MTEPIFAKGDRVRAVRDRDVVLTIASDAVEWPNGWMYFCEMDEGDAAAHGRGRQPRWFHEADLARFP